MQPFNLVSSMRNQLLLVCSTGTALVLTAALVGMTLQWNAIQGLTAALGDLRAADPATVRLLASAERALWGTAAMMGLACVIAFWAFMWLLQTRLVRRTRALAEDLTRLAAGDFSTPVDSRNDDELGQVARSAETIRRDLGALIGQIREGAATLKDSVDVVAAGATNVAASSGEQSRAASSTATSMEQLARAMQTITENAQSASRLSQDSLQQSRSVQGKLGEVRRVVDEAAHVITQVADATRESVASMQKINGMTRQVREIADQTNLLALNAAIEAARAGEAGRGFAVVADEVRKLAEKSAQSAAGIDRITETLDRQSVGLESAVAHGLTTIHSSRSGMDDTVRALEAATDAVARASEALNEIASAVREQSRSNAEMAANIEHIASMVENNNAAVNDMTHSTETLHALASTMRSRVDAFHL